MMDSIMGHHKAPMNVIERKDMGHLDWLRENSTEEKIHQDSHCNKWLVWFASRNVL